MGREHTTGVAWKDLIAKFDPGWIFVLLGLVILASALLIPSWRETRQMESLWGEAQAAEARIQRRMTMSTAMMDRLQQGDASVLERVLMADRNQRAPGEPILQDLAAPSQVLQWLEASVQQAERLEGGRPLEPVRRSDLEDLVTGPWRLWLLAGGTMLLCLGVVLGPSRLRGEKSHEGPFGRKRLLG